MKLIIHVEVLLLCFYVGDTVARLLLQLLSQ